ncbi:MAG: hypothetical protein HUU16_21830 [Candidatus Omnitrophica bacterium]|nr:hypothetical protein [Candidatus Omnitrophota bacterium]
MSSSLIGPFVGFHHQALLIGVVWPEGKGNVGHGCNCGSNHTGKAPDQEFWPGEGMFLGLGVNVKFPGCFTEAPYTFIATGTNLAPQRVAFPFSLIAPPSRYPRHVRPGLNEIIPGWVLDRNLFALLRGEQKFAERDRSFRSQLERRVFRREIIERMLAARARLAEIEGEEVYTESEAEGLGENFLTEKSRLRAMEVYSFHIQLFALEGLFLRCADRGKVSSTLIRRPSADPEWEFRRTLILSEGLGSSPSELLRLYVERMKTVALRIEESKSRDDQRGARSIPDYADHHLLAAENRFVRDFRDKVAAVEDQVLDLVEG